MGIKKENPMKLFIKAGVASVLAALITTSALADGFGTPASSSPTTGFGTASTSTPSFPTGTWGIILEGNASWMSGAVGQGSVFSSNPALEGTVTSVTDIFEDVAMDTDTTAGPECGISCEAVNLGISGTWTTNTDVTSSITGTGAGTMVDGVLNPFMVGSRAQTQGGIDVDFAFDFTFGDDVTVPEPAE
jgi:hypothetical protein